MFSIDSLSFLSANSAVAAGRLCFLRFHAKPVFDYGVREAVETCGDAALRHLLHGTDRRTGEGSCFSAVAWTVWSPPASKSGLRIDGSRQPAGCAADGRAAQRNQTHSR